MDAPQAGTLGGIMHADSQQAVGSPQQLFTLKAALYCLKYIGGHFGDWSAESAWATFLETRYSGVT